MSVSGHYSKFGYLARRDCFVSGDQSGDVVSDLGARAERAVNASEVSAVLRAAESIPAPPTPHEIVVGNPNSELMQRLRHADVLSYAHAAGYKKVIFLGGYEGDAVVVDVELGRFAAALDAVDALAPLLPGSDLAHRARSELRDSAVRAMIDQSREGYTEGDSQ